MPFIVGPLIMAFVLLAANGRELLASGVAKRDRSQMRVGAVLLLLALLVLASVLRVSASVGPL